MIDKMRLDDLSFESNLEQALQLLEQKAPWWTHTEASDPGVTLLELWSLLTDIQNGYLDQVKEMHYRKYLRLAGVAPDQGEKALAWVCVGNVKDKTVLPKGTKMLAGEVAFETGQEELLTDHEIIAFEPGGKEDALEDNEYLFMGASRQYGFPLTREEDGSLFIIYLRRALEAGESIKILFLLQEAEGRNRPDRENFCLARLCWEYKTNNGWKKLETLSDDTHGLLYSGHMVIKRPWTDGHGKDNEATGFTIRCRIEEGGFDRMPVLQHILLNGVKVCQQDTLCSTLYFAYESGPEDNKSVDISADRLFSDYAALTGEMEVFIRTREGDWELCGGDGGVTDCVQGDSEKPSSYGNGEKLKFIGSSLKGVWPQDRTVVKVVCRHPDFALMNPPLEITGAAGQEIVLPWNNIFRESVSLQLKQCAGSRIFREYECTDQESTVTCAWHWAEEPEAILLGDGRHGCIPEASWEEGMQKEDSQAGQAYWREGLCITSLVLWDGKKGNVSAGRICAWEKPEMFKGLTISNPLPASGGRDRLTAREHFTTLQDKWSVLHCAVTVEDYARLAEKTPGLIISEATARTDGLRLVVNIQLPQDNADSCMKEAYIREVGRYLEGHRLIHSDIVVEIAE